MPNCLIFLHSPIDNTIASADFSWFVVTAWLFCRASPCFGCVFYFSLDSDTLSIIFCNDIAVDPALKRFYIKPC